MKYGLIGEKLGHSYSKLIHESLGRYSYDLLSLTKEEFEDFLVKREFSGLNITIPYKKAAMPFCDQISDLAKEIGAVNTLYFQGGKLCGTNTDYAGFLYASRRAGISFDGKKVLILGNGGTSLMARKAVSDQGARQILITTRRGEEGCVSYEALDQHKDVEIIVNTTPVGTYPNNGRRLIDLKDFPACQGVIDVIYNPFETALLQQAKELGIPHTNGLPMLVAQATAAAEYFLGEGDFQQENERIIKTLQEEIENRILFGGERDLAEKAARECGKTFTVLENASLCAEIGKEKGLFIYVPDGVHCSPEELKALTQNGRIVSI